MPEEFKNANSGQNAPSDTPSPEVGATDSVRDAEIKVQEAAKVALDAKMSPEDRDVAKARQDADDVRAKAAADDASAKALPPAMSVAEARMLVPAIDPTLAAATDEMGAGDHMAQRFGNYPENPAPLSAAHADPELCTVQLYMTVPDHPLGARTTVVHPEMVGDYLRAGWSRSL